MNQVYVPPSGPPMGAAPSRELYARMGEDNIFQMCRDFYARLEQSDIRSMFPEDMPLASEKLAAFLVGLTGGPPLYHQRHGEPRMRARHLKFPIDQHARDVWVDCFKATLVDAPRKYAFPEEHLPSFIRFLEGFGTWMMNRGP